MRCGFGATFKSAKGAAPFLCHVRMGGRIASEYGITIREPDPAQHLPL